MLAEMAERGRESRSGLKYIVLSCLKLLVLVRPRS